ncbi:BatD family protein [Schleiferiaceae bacterium]|nr:BatD family protein [Schleiferiaceae bacterium]
MKRIGNLFSIVALFLSVHCSAQNIELTAKCSRRTVGLNEPFRITFSTNSRKGEITPPNFEQFIVVSGPYQSSQTQIINGRYSSNRSLSYEVVAQKKGEFILPSASILVDNKRIESNELKITVKEGLKKKNTTSKRVKDSFKVTILSSKKEVYVGEPIILKFRATLFDPVRDLNIIQAPNFENVLQQQLDSKEERSREVVGNKIATIFDFDKRLILPNKRGILGGQELKISGKVQVPTGRRDFFNMPLMKYVPQVASAKIPAVRIKPLPEGAPSTFTGGVGKLKLIREISRREVSGDQSITIKLRIEGNGNLSTLEIPELRNIEGFDIYDPKFNENIRYDERGITGYKEYEYLLVPQYRGSFMLPEVTWTYFDLKAEKYKTITITEDTLTVRNPNLAASKPNSNVLASADQESALLDEDIRYLQDIDFKVDRKGQLRSLTLIFGAILSLCWLWQLAPRRTLRKSENWRKGKLKDVQKAFNAKDGARYGTMLNAIEFGLVERGLNLENITKTELQNTYGNQTGVELFVLIENCNLAQYAPVTSSNDESNLNAFVEVWKMI